MKRSDSILLNFYNSKLPKYQQRGLVSMIPRSTGDFSTNMGIPSRSQIEKQYEARKTYEEWVRLQQEKLRQEEARRRQTFVGPADTRVSTQIIKKEQAEQRARQQAQQRSPLAQTFASFTPTGNPAAGAIGAEMFVNMNPITSPITSGGRLAQFATGQNPYGENPVFNAIGLTFDVAGVGALKMLPGSTGIGKAIDRTIYPTRTYRFEAPGGNPQIYEASELASKVASKGDWTTKSLDDLFQYGTKRGLLEGKDLNLIEYKVPFWKRNIKSDKDVIALKESQGESLFEMNPNEYIIPRNNFFYPKRSTLVKAVPEEMMTDPMFSRFSNPLSYSHYNYASKPYEYIADQINAVTGHRAPFTYKFDPSVSLREQDVPLYNWRQPQFAPESGIGSFQRPALDIGNFLTTQTPLKNAWKLNPFAYKQQPDMMYRGIGQAGLEDAAKVGYLRSNANVEPYMVKGLDLSKRFGKNVYFSPNLSTAEQYGQGVIAAVPRSAGKWIARYPRQGANSWSQFTQTQFPTEMVEFYKPHWLKRLAPIQNPVTPRTFPTIWEDLRGLNAQNVNEILDVSENLSDKGLFNYGVYPTKKNPNILVKVENLKKLRSMIDPDAAIESGLPKLMSDINDPSISKSLMDVDLSNKNLLSALGYSRAALLDDNMLAGRVMTRVQGSPLTALLPSEMENIPTEAYQQVLNNMRMLQGKNIGFDLIGENLLYNPETKRFGMIDLAKIPSSQGQSGLSMLDLYGIGNQSNISKYKIQQYFQNKIKGALSDVTSSNTGEYGSDVYGNTLNVIFDKIRNIKKQGGPIVNPRGYMDGQPPKGSNWRIPGDTLYNPTPNKIRAISDNGIEKILNPFDETQVEFPGAQYVDEYKMKMGGLSPNKAREILHDGTVHGRPLTEKQRRFFGAMSKGHTKKYQLGGNALAMLRDYGGGISVPRLNSPLPKAQLGIPVKSITPIISPILELTKIFTGDKKETVSEKPKAPEVTLGQYFNIVDPRKIRATTGQPINPNVDLVAGQYPSSYIAQELKLAKQKGLSKEDAWNLAAIAFQESGWGKTDHNLGHVIGPAGKGNYGSTLINAYMNKMAEADRLGITDPYTRLQVYNGLGKIFPSTEQKYHGFKMKKIYGVPVPQGGLNLRDNPLYGKQVIDIRENVLKKNPEVVQYLDSLYKKDGGSFGAFGYVGKGWYKNGGQHGGLDRWFAEKWVDVKTGKPCGRQEGESRAYPACRPSRRVSSKTPKTSGEMSSSEKAKFKSSKTSSQRIPYNHKRR